MEVLFEGKRVPALSVSRIAIWNAGTETLRGSDVAPRDPLCILHPSSADILKVKIIESSRTALEVALTATSADQNSGQITFEFLDPGDGFLLEVVHTSTSVNTIGIAGSIMGARVVRTAADPAFTTTSASHGPPIYSIESYRKNNLELARFLLWVSLFLAVSTALSFALHYREFGSATLFASALSLVVFFADADAAMRRSKKRSNRALPPP